jgi:hypothetical protein
VTYASDLEWIREGYFSVWYLGDIAWLPYLTESYFRNNADLGTGLLMAQFAITSPHFFCDRPASSRPRPPLFSQRFSKLLHPSNCDYPFVSGFSSGFLENSCGNVSEFRYRADKRPHLES